MRTILAPTSQRGDGILHEIKCSGCLEKCLAPSAYQWKALREGWSSSCHLVAELLLSAISSTWQQRETHCALRKATSLGYMGGWVIERTTLDFSSSQISGAWDRALHWAPSPFALRPSPFALRPPPPARFSVSLKYIKSLNKKRKRKATRLLGHFSWGPQSWWRGSWLRCF